MFLQNLFLIILWGSACHDLPIKFNKNVIFSFTTNAPTWKIKICYLINSIIITSSTKKKFSHTILMLID